MLRFGGGGGVCTEAGDEERNVAFEGFDITTFYGSERWQFESDVFGEDRIHREMSEM